MHVHSRLKQVATDHVSHAVSLGTGSPDRRPTVKLVQHFPMYTVPVQIVAKMSGWRAHDDLIQDNMLVLVGRDAKVIFISHTWLGYLHPDPRCQQLRALQKIVISLACGRHELHPFWIESVGLKDRCISADVCKELFTAGSVWLDYWSVPQATDTDDAAEQQAAAIRSIPAYITRADCFLALVPPCTHVDSQQLIGHNEWRQRTWCRLEMMIYIFSHEQPEIIIAESESHAYLAANHKWCSMPVGLGKLTCCSLGHKVLRKDGTERCIPCDKILIRTVLGQVYRSKIDSFEKAGDWERYRLYISLWPHIFVGLGIASEEAAEPLPDFLERYRFRGAFDEEGPRGSGWTPLRVASLECNLPVMKELLAMKADVESPLRAVQMDVWHFRKASILFSVTSTHSNPHVLQLLLEAGASVDAVCLPEKINPLQLCKTPEALEVYLERGVSLLRVTDILNMDMLMTSLIRLWDGSGSEEHVLYLIEKKAFAQSWWFFGHSHLHLAVMTGSLNVTRHLLERVEFIEAAEASQNKSKCNALGRCILEMMALRNRVSAGVNVAVTIASEALRCSPLHFAACQNNLAMCKLLLQYGLPLHATNHRGRTPIHLAALVGHEQTVKLFLSHPSGPAVAKMRCTHARKTAAELAEQAGFEHIADLLPEQNRLETRILMSCPLRRRTSRGGEDPTAGVNLLRAQVKKSRN